MQRLLSFSFLIFGLKCTQCQTPFYLPTTIRDHILSISAADNGHNKIPEENVLKSVYFFQASQQSEQYPIRIRFPPPHKKIRVVFIKPPEPVLVPEIIPPRPSEERTVIYVLSKQLEHVASITIPSSYTSVVKKKPEVYYIRYRDLKHARDLISKGLQDLRAGNKVGSVIKPVSDENSFIKTLEDSSVLNKTSSYFSNIPDVGASYFGHDRKRDESGVYGVY